MRSSFQRPGVPHGRYKPGTFLVATASFLGPREVLRVYEIELATGQSFAPALPEVSAWGCTDVPNGADRFPFENQN
jgi:hypothetical protein